MILLLQTISFSLSNTLYPLIEHKLGFAFNPYSIWLSCSKGLFLICYLIGKISFSSRSVKGLLLLLLSISISVKFNGE